MWASPFCWAGWWVLGLVPVEAAHQGFSFLWWVCGRWALGSVPVEAAHAQLLPVCGVIRVREGQRRSVDGLAHLDIRASSL
jgi:hypothetical protein